MREKYPYFLDDFGLEDFGLPDLGLDAFACFPWSAFWAPSAVYAR